MAKSKSTTRRRAAPANAPATATAAVAAPKAPARTRAAVTAPAALASAPARVVPAPAAPRVRTALVDPVLEAASVLPQPKATVDLMAAAMAEDKVTVYVPHGFPFTLDNHQIVQINPGQQRLPKSFAEHWFVKAQGVTQLQE